MDSTKILAFVLAGGEGTRLRPLTAEHAKPALPFAAGFRIIDFVLSNLVNSGISSIYVLAKYKPRSLVEHIRTVWAPWANGKNFIEVVLPEDCDAGSFNGTSHAVYQNLHLIGRHRPDLVAVFAADHVYRMDVRQMANFHRQHDADVTIAAIPVPIGEATEFGILATARDGGIDEFHEKPARPAAIPGDPGHAYASMGNYLFKPRVLEALLEEASRRGDTDFGKHIMPRLPGTCRALAYNFARNRIPGIQPYEERGYWRDIGTFGAYQAALLDVLDPIPRFSLENPEWPIRGAGYQSRPALDAALDARIMTAPFSTARRPQSAMAASGLAAGESRRRSGAGQRPTPAAPARTAGSLQGHRRIYQRAKVDLLEQPVAGGERAK